MKRIDLFVFDFDGTLIDSKRDIADSVNLALRETGVRTLPREILFSFIGKGVEHLMTRALQGTGVRDIPQAIACFKKHYGQHLLDHTRFYPNGREIVSHFAHKKNAIHSNKPAEFIERILRKLDFLHPFISILGGDSLEKKKPDPQGLHLMMETHRVGAEKVVIIGDSVVDIETGKRAGVATCAVSYGLTGRDTLERARPDWIIDNLADLKQLFH